MRNSLPGGGPGSFCEGPWGDVRLGSGFVSVRQLVAGHGFGAGHAPGDRGQHRHRQRGAGGGRLSGGRRFGLVQGPAGQESVAGVGDAGDQRCEPFSIRLLLGRIASYGEAGRDRVGQRGPVPALPERDRAVGVHPVGGGESLLLDHAGTGGVGGFAGGRRIGAVQLQRPGRQHYAVGDDPRGRLVGYGGGAF